MCKQLRAFIAGQSGAITVDWVIVSAGVIALSLGVSAVIAGGTASLASQVSTSVADSY